MMNIQNDVSLAEHSTMRLGGPAKYLVDITNHQDLSEAVAWANTNHLPVIMIGDGSNIVWGDAGYNGLVMVNKISGFETFEETAGNFYITVGGGEHWDDVVDRTVQQGLSGIESLSLIPGTAGATPVQNVGAYGQEIADSLVSVEAYDHQSNSFVTIPKLDCHFSYRHSRFNTDDKGRFFITAITLHLTKSNLRPPFYPSLQTYLQDHNISAFNPAVIRQAVIDIRSSKLPDPKLVANNGSFFANPIIDAKTFEQLQSKFPDIASWAFESGYKISGAWLIDRAGFKDNHDPQTGMATWPKQPLVLINEHAKSTADLLTYKQKIIDKVHETFGITLIQEPELIRN